MRKNLLTKSIAVMLCLAFISLSASGLFAIEKKASKLDSRTLLRKPLYLLVSMFPVLKSIIQLEKREAKNTVPSRTPIVKPTGELSSGRPSVSD